MRPRRPPAPVLWCTPVAADGQSWPVYFDVPEFSASLGGIVRKGVPRDAAMGVADFDRHLIVINVRRSEDEQDLTLLHELGHVALHVRNPRMSVAAQHRVLNPLDESLCALLVGAGARFPKRPRAYAAFRRWALETAPE